MYSAALSLRWERALKLNRDRISEVGPGQFLVPSAHGLGAYFVQVRFDATGKLSAASCSCPDFTKTTEELDTPLLHGVRICKHVLCAGLKAKESAI